MSADDYDSLWEIADLAFEEFKDKKEVSKPREDLNSKGCNHGNVCEGVCMDCGLCLESSEISYEGEWNNYKDESGGFAKNNQRCDVFTDNNPYSTGGTLLTCHKNSLMAKLQIQQTFSHKQKTYWMIGEELERVASILNINNRITINLIIFGKGLSLVKIELFTLKKDNEGCDKDAWVYLPNLYQKKIITGIIINIKRYSGFAKYKSVNIIILLLYQNSLKF